MAKPNLCPQSPFFCFLFFGEAKKTRSPKEDEFLRSKNEAFVRRVRFNAAKRVPRAGMRRKGEQAKIAKAT